MYLAAYLWPKSRYCEVEMGSRPRRELCEAALLGKPFNTKLMSLHLVPPPPRSGAIALEIWDSFFF